MSEEKLKAELARARQQAQEYLAGWQRAKADYLNLQKETEKRRQETVEFANALFMSEVLPVYNHFKLALKHLPPESQGADWLVGLEQIHKQFQEFLKKYNISEIPTVGEKFDHNLHEAVAHEEREGFEPDQIFEEVQPGYLLGDKVLAPAKVKVAK